ncbi:MAG: DUF4150 domain-containing protein [Deltaproteobacteria bacterium]|nr:DUF4150 domain-containing protein [Deltaproteobacteria bacterium]
MFPASTTQGGNCMAMPPDVCLVPAPPLPPIPTPFPNTAMLNQATNTSMKVMIINKPVVTLKSKIPKTMGDEAGVAGGVASGMNMGPASFKIGGTKVKVEGQPCVHLTSMSGHNGINANAPAGTQVSPSQTKVIIAP